MLLVGSVYSDQGTVRRIDISGNTRTQTAVIRRELLFEPGDTLTTDLIEETSRNLRALLFLGDVSVSTRQDGAFVDVQVSVSDLYARAITPLLSGEPGELSYGAVGLDYNFLGRGQIVEVTAEHDAVTGNRVRMFFREPRVKGSRIRMDLDGELASEGHRAFVTLSRPFYRLAERWAASVSGFSEASITRLYNGQSLTEKYTSNEKGGSLSMQRSYGDDVKIRSGLFLALTDRSSDAEPGYTYAPSGRRRVLPSIGVTVWRPRYETTRFYNRLGRTEDVQTGGWITARAGASLEALGSDRDYRFVILDVNPRFRPAEEVYVTGRLTYRSRFSNGDVWNIFGSASGKVLLKVREAHAVAARIRFDALARTEDVTQYLLGPERGLRGYSLRRFDGSRRLVFNLEARPTFVRKRDLTVAGAVFVDVGSAWTPSRGDRVLATAVGIGGRVGMNRVYNSPVLRGDLGYGFEDRAWVIYVGLGQYF